ncbi:MAG TPA: anthranilate phosphoribosyltransferase [Rhizomicrobium sp.]|jgi:anthranilate phosphoribosyltransferase|nr:anthranilate phosphoribosyltransferase [Rhizomicrobium sp.]
MSADEDFPSLLKRLAEGRSLSAESSLRAFGAIMAGEVSEARMAAFLTALTLREPTVAEIVGAARAMRAAMRTIEAPAGAIDLCGTGGDGRGTLNISTAASFVVAACGVPVAKHGNRNMSSRAGAADVLEALHVRIDLTPQAAQTCLDRLGICFLFAPAYHPAMKHVAPVRKELGFRTVFNLLGPISNPAQVHRQVLGVFAERWVEPLANVLVQLGTEHAWIVHGRDGMDELTTTDASLVVEIAQGKIRRFQLTPEDVGLGRVSPEDVKGGDAAFNANELEAMLQGDGNCAYRDIVVLNAAAALVVGGKAADISEGACQADAAIRDGGAFDMLARLRTTTQALAS